MSVFGGWRSGKWIKHQVCLMLGEARGPFRVLFFSLFVLNHFFSLWLGLGTKNTLTDHHIKNTFLVSAYFFLEYVQRGAGSIRQRFQFILA